MDNNYLQFDQQCYKQEGGLAIDAPTSAVLAETYLQHNVPKHSSILPKLGCHSHSL
jgi:hypothetical protein